MSAYLSNELANTTTGLTTAATTGYKPTSTNGYNSRLRRFRATVTLASQTTNDTITLATLPSGTLFEYGVVNTDTSLGGSVLTLGITGSTAKYMGSAVFTTTNTPTLIGKTATTGAASPFSSDETILATIAGAALPASGTLVVDLLVSAG